jgi:hypothetical protein
VQRSSSIITNLSSGEVSPTVGARIDIKQYQDSARVLENAIVGVHGYAEKRPGSYFVSEVKDSTKKVKLIPFKFSSLQEYMLEFGEQYIRLYANHGRISSFVTSGMPITGAANNGAGLIRITCPSHGFSTGNTVVISGVLGTTEANATWGIAVINGDTFDLVGSAFVHTYTPGNTGNLLTNGSFTSDTSGWSSIPYTSLASISGGQAGNCLLVSNTIYASPFTAYQILLNLIIGKTYVFSVYVKTSGNANPYQVGVADPTTLVFLPGASASGTSTGSWVNVTFSWVCTQKTIAIALSGFWHSASLSILFDEVNFVTTVASQGLAASFVAEIPTPYLEDDLFSIDYKQSGDVLYLAHSNYPPAKLSRNPNNVWKYEVISFQMGDKPIANVIAGSGTPSLARLTVYKHGFSSNTYVYVAGVLGATEVNGLWKITVIDVDNFDLVGSTFAANYGYIFSGSVTQTLPITGAADNGSGLIRITELNHGFITGQPLLITGVTGTTEANGTWEITVIDENTYDLNRSVFRNTYVSGGYGIPVLFGSVNNYPSCVAFFEQRLVWAASLNQPQTVWLSVTGDFERLVTGIDDDSAIIYTLNSGGIEGIRWLISQNVLLIGTTDSEWRLGGATITEPMTPTSVLAKRQSNNGSAKLKAMLIGDLALYVNYYGTKIFQIGYAFVSDTFSSAELTKLANHITKGGILDVAYQGSPNIVAWFVRSDGILVSMTFYTEEKIIAFSRQITSGLCESIATIHGETEDEIWIVVNRTIGGTTKRYIEYFMPRDFTQGEPETPTRPSPFFFVDAGLIFDGGEPVTITAATAAKPVVITYAGDDPTSGWYVRIEDVLGMTDLNGNVFKIANVNTTNKTFELLVDGSAFTAYISGGTWSRVVNSVSGLDHLEGETVDICADGAAVTPQVVASGALSFDSFFNRVAAGLNYKWKVVPQIPEINVPTGTSAGLQKSIERITARLYNTIGLKAGPDEDRAADIPFGVENELFSGDIPIEFMGDGGDITLIHDQPLPCTLLGLMILMDVMER